MSSGKPYYRWLPVKCSDCAKQWSKRDDTIAAWLGRCRSCAMKIMAATPEAKVRQRENGRRIVAKLGKLPGPKFENRPRGDRHYNWRGGITSEQTKIRGSLDMRKWRAAVFERDKFKCQICGINDHKLHADHVKPFAAYPELRFDVDNGRTLCQPCHRKHGAIIRLGIVVREAFVPRNDHWRIG